jgi:hypothetical protein
MWNVDLCREPCTLRFFSGLQTRGERLRPPKSCKTVHFVDWIVVQELTRPIESIMVGKLPDLWPKFYQWSNEAFTVVAGKDHPFAAVKLREAKLNRTRVVTLRHKQVL